MANQINQGGSRLDEAFVFFWLIQKNEVLLLGDALWPLKWRTGGGFGPFWILFEAHPNIKLNRIGWILQRSFLSSPTCSNTSGSRSASYTFPLCKSDVETWWNVFVSWMGILTEVARYVTNEYHIHIPIAIGLKKNMFICVRLRYLFISMQDFRVTLGAWGWCKKYCPTQSRCSGIVPSNSFRCLESQSQDIATKVDMAKCLKCKVPRGQSVDELVGTCWYNKVQSCLNQFQTFVFNIDGCSIVHHLGCVKPVVIGMLSATLKCLTRFQPLTSVWF